jgi:hypothetical protein
MRFIYFAELLLVAAAIALLITQVLVPLFLGKQLFPLFRKQGRLEAELAEVNQERANRRLKKFIKRERRK